MSQSLTEHCQEVYGKILHYQEEQKECARRLLEAKIGQRYPYIRPYLQAELAGHMEARSVWPYLLGIPNSSESLQLCSLYDCPVSKYGEVVQKRIDELTQLLDVVDNRLNLLQNKNSFWLSIRDELVTKICKEAHRMLEDKK